MSESVYEVAAANGVDLNGCHFGVNVITCGGPSGLHHRIVWDCPTCERRTSAVERFDGAFLGTTIYCLQCLDGFTEGYRMKRPGEGYISKARADDIHRLYDSAIPSSSYEALVDYKVHETTCNRDSDDSRCDECLRAERAARVALQTVKNGGDPA